MNGFRSYEDLRVFRLAETLSDEIWRMVSCWAHFEKSTIGHQLVRAVDSIGANIAEGAGRGTPKENQRFIRIARASLYETRFWIKRCAARKLITQPQLDKIQNDIGILAPSLNAYINSFTKQQNNKQQNNK